MEEMYEETESERSHLGRKGYIKRWLVLLGVGILVGIARELAPMFLPLELAVALSFIVSACYALPALIFSVVWTMDRAADAGKNELWGLLILVPIVNVVALVVFSALPSRSR